MKVDKNATRYGYGNGRFDLMSDEEVRTLTWGDFEMFFARLSDAMQQGESSSMQELYHQLYELKLRYQGRACQVNILPDEKDVEE